MKTHYILFLISTFLLTGCASNYLGSYAQFDAVGGVASPLQISARFDSRACSDYFAYIDISIHNPSDSWQKINNIDFNFPFSSESQFSIVRGDRLTNWAESERRRRGRSEYNSSVAGLAVSLIGVGLMASDSKKARNAGAVMALGSGISSSTNEISDDINAMETARSTSNNYFVGNEVEIAPGMTRKFWLVLNATDEAPLMAWLGAGFDDGDAQRQDFKVPLSNWTSCQWQGKRKKYLQGLSRVRSGKGIISGAPSNGRQVGSAFDKGHLLEVEIKLQQKKDLKG